MGIKKLKKPKSFIDYSQTFDDVLENLDDYNTTKKKIPLVVLDIMIADIEANKKISSIVTELFFKDSVFQLFLFHNLILKYLKM